MLIKVTKIEPVEGFRLRLRFSDQMHGIYDCSPIIASGGPMVVPLRNPAFFCRVFLEHGAPTWPNGYDLAPWALHKELADAGALAPTSSIPVKAERPTGGRADYHVTPSAQGRWEVRREGAVRASAIFDRKSEAMARGRELAQTSGAVLVEHGKDGRVLDSTSFGNDPNPPRDRIRVAPAGRKSLRSA
jgi:hypothetical protein